MNRAELYAQAMAALRRDRQRAITRAEENKQLAYDRIPRLLVLDNLTIETGLALAKLGAARAPAEKLAEKQTALTAIEDERAALLRENGFPSDFLQPKFSCPVCQDTGWDKEKVCGCVQRKIRALRRAELMKSAPLDLCRFDNFDLNRYPDQPIPPARVSARKIMEGNLAYCRQYAAEFSGDCPSLFLSGNAGLGKTHLALAIAGELLAKGVEVLYLSSQTAFGTIERDRYLDGGELLAEMLEAELLILDDLGTECLSPYVSSCIYRLVDSRLNAHKPTIYTSNLQSQKTVNLRYSEKVGSRLFGECEILLFYGEDQRLAHQYAKE